MVAGIIDEHLIQIEGIKAHLNHCAVRALLHGVLVGVQLDLPVFTDRAIFFPQEQAVEAF